MKIYLSGGMKGTWQDEVRKIEGHIYFDPRDHGLTSPLDYVKEDLRMIREADLVFAYLEFSNPSGIGLSAELGYAKALGKKIWLCCEKEEKKWEFIKTLSDLVWIDFDLMLEKLRSGT